MRNITVLSDIIPQWFKDMTKEGQEDYLKDHPNSRIAHTVNKAKQVIPTRPKIRKEKPVEKKPDHKDAVTILEDKGSPTDFKGPSSAGNSLSGNPRLERKIVSKIDRLAQLSKEAIAKGDKAPDFDMCQISIPGTNLFCEGNIGIPRKEMPQLKGKPVPGSWADKNLPKDKNGEVDAEQAFRKMLEDKGIKTVKEKVPVDELKATQSQMVGSKIAGMFQALKKDPTNKGITAPIFISNDNYVLDGHHRWAAMVAMDMSSGLKQPVEMTVEKVNLPIEELVKMTNDFADEIGIAQKAGKVKESSSTDNNMESLIKVAADSIKKLRTSDVYRVLSECPEKDRKSLGEYIERKRSDLKDEVRDVLKEEFNIELSSADCGCGCNNCGGKNKEVSASKEEKQKVIEVLKGMKKHVNDWSIRDRILRLAKELLDTEYVQTNEEEAIGMLEEMIRGVVSGGIRQSDYDDILETFARWNKENSSIKKPKITTLATDFYLQYKVTASHTPWVTLGYDNIMVSTVSKLERKYRKEIAKVVGVKSNEISIRVVDSKVNELWKSK
jgi:hypothetical protein